MNLRLFFLNCILLLAIAAFSQEPVALFNKAKFVFREKTLTGESFDLGIELNDAAFSSYRRLTMQLPKGFSYKISHKADAISQGDQQNVKLLWTGPVVAPTQKINIIFSTEPGIEGNFRIPVIYEFLHEQQKKIFTLGSLDLQVSKTKRVDDNLSKNLTFDLPDLAQSNTRKALQNSFYSIQMLQSSEYVSEAQLRKYFNLEQEKITEMLQDGKYYYLTGGFSDEKDAKNWLTKHPSLSMQGLVVKVVNGKIINN